MLTLASALQVLPLSYLYLSSAIDTPLSSTMTIKRYNKQLSHILSKYNILVARERWSYNKPEVIAMKYYINNEFICVFAVYINI
jgi:hypothetical protein